MRPSNQEQNKIKIILVGESGVGKTNIRERFCQNKFDSQSVKTVGVQVSTRKFMAPYEQRQQKFTAHIWDVLGDIKNKELSPFYFKSAVGVIYVFDLTNEESLHNLALWKERVEEDNNENKKSILIGNKLDLKQLREVSPEAAYEFQSKHSIDLYWEVSARETQGGVQEALTQFLGHIEQQFIWGLTRPRLRKQEGYHRICI